MSINLFHIGLGLGKKVVDTCGQFSILRLPNGERATAQHPDGRPPGQLFDSSIDVASESKHRTEFFSFRGLFCV